MEDFQSFTVNSEFSLLGHYIRETQNELNLHWTLSLLPMLPAETSYEPFMEAYRNDLFVLWPSHVPNNRILSGVPTDRNVYYDEFPYSSTLVASLDFWQNKTFNWWVDQCVQFHNSTPFDAVSLVSYKQKKP